MLYLYTVNVGYQCNAVCYNKLKFMSKARSVSLHNNSYSGFFFFCLRCLLYLKSVYTESGILSSHYIITSLKQKEIMKDIAFTLIHCYSDSYLNKIKYLAIKAKVQSVPNILSFTFCRRGLDQASGFKPLNQVEIAILSLNSKNGLE